MTVVLGKWDLGLDFNEARIKLETTLRTLGTYLTMQTNRDRRNGTRFVYFSIAYIQLMNGSRVSEAIEALREYVKTGKTEFSSLAKKTKVPRMFKIPKLIQNYRYLYREYEDIVFKVTKKDVGQLLKKEFGWNTHSLRYAFIRHAIEKGYSAEVLALILGHKKIDTTLNYARNIKAEKILEELQE